MWCNLVEIMYSQNCLPRLYCWNYFMSFIFQRLVVGYWIALNSRLELASKLSLLLAYKNARPSPSTRTWIATTPKSRIIYMSASHNCISILASCLIHFTLRELCIKLTIQSISRIWARHEASHAYKRVIFGPSLHQSDKQRLSRFNKTSQDFSEEATHGLFIGLSRVIVIAFQQLYFPSSRRSQRIEMIIRHNRNHEFMFIFYYIAIYWCNGRIN